MAASIEGSVAVRNPGQRVLSSEKLGLRFLYRLDEFGPIILHIADRLSNPPQAQDDFWSGMEKRR